MIPVTATTNNQGNGQRHAGEDDHTDNDTTKAMGSTQRDPSYEYPF